MSDFLQLLSTVASFVLLAVAIVVAAYAALKGEQLKTVRENNNDLLQRVDLLEKSEHRLTDQLEAEQRARRVDVEAMTAQYEAAKSENQVLRDAFVFPEQLTEIRDLVETHHTEAKEWWTDAGEALHSAVNSLAELVTALQERES